MYLSLICRAIHAKQVFEIGTLYGYTAFLLALNTSESARIFTLDIPADAGLALNATISDVATRIANYKANQLIFQGSPVEGKITVLKGDSANFDFSRWYGQIDVFFIDGSHSYEYVKSDTEHALKCCHSGSVILSARLREMGSKWRFKISTQTVSAVSYTLKTAWVKHGSVAGSVSGFDFWCRLLYATVRRPRQIIDLPEGDSSAGD